jgi:hypothetical protein
MWAFVALLGGLQLLTGFMLMRLWKAVDDNTVAVTKIAVDMPKGYATKDELKEVEHFLRQRTHEIANEIHTHELKAIAEAHRP